MKCNGILCRIGVTAAILTAATVVWLAAALVYDHISRADAWHAYRECRTPLLLGSISVVIALSFLLLWKAKLAPGRVISAIIIGLVAAALILPATSMSPHRRRECVARDRFWGFRETTVQYAAFSVPVAIGFLVREQLPPNQSPHLTGPVAR
jgi:hypothetical protein